VGSFRLEAAKAGAMSTQWERAEKKRREKLQLIDEQVESGQLKIRKMTPAERAKHPPRSRLEKRGHR
jgi:hypothetical protein